MMSRRLPSSARVGRRKSRSRLLMHATAGSLLLLLLLPRGGGGFVFKLPRPPVDRQAPPTTTGTTTSTGTTTATPTPATAAAAPTRKGGDDDDDGGADVKPSRSKRRGGGRRGDPSRSTAPSSSPLSAPSVSEGDEKERLEWGLINASTSFGNLLMQMQMHNESLPLDAVAVLDLDHQEQQQHNRHQRGTADGGGGGGGNNKDDYDDAPRKSGSRRQGRSVEPPPPARGSAQGVKAPSSTTQPPPPMRPLKAISTISLEAAKELDEAVVRLNAAYATEDLTVLPMNSMYGAAKAQQPPPPSVASAANLSSGLPLPPLSRPEHYRDRIGRDLRHLSIGVASATESADQWRAFCQEGGGLYPLLETIREGAERLKKMSLLPQVNMKKSHHPSDDHVDYLIIAACNACRALRDVAALSPEVAAVLTDGVLRANAAWDGGLFSDFKTCLAFARDFSEPPPGAAAESARPSRISRSRRRDRREARLRSRLYIHQLLLAMTCASDDAITAIRETPGLADAILACSSFARKEQTRRWLRYPGELVKFLWRRSKNRRVRGPFLEAASIDDDLNGQVQKAANLVLAAIGRNHWVPKSPTQRGLRIICLDGGGSRGMASVTALQCLMEFVGEGINVADAFDILGGTSTGGIISFLTGLRGETCAQASERYNQLIKQIFVKSALSTPRLFLTTASYDESHFMEILSKILEDETMLDSRADPRTPLVFCVTSKMSSTPTHVALFRNYNYASGELADHFTVDPTRAREDVGIPLEMEHDVIRRGRYSHKGASVSSPGVRTSDGSRHPGSFRVLQRYALRASTAAPTVFKPVMMGGEMYCDGGIVASNPTAIAIHEARTLFPDVPIEMVISIGTGGFLEQKNSPKIGWDGIIGQIVNSACDAEQTHHILEDILGDPCVLGRASSVSRTRYYRFNPVLGPPDEFPIDVTDPDKLAKLRQITLDYMNEPAQQAKMRDIAGILKGKNKWSRWLAR